MASSLLTLHYRLQHALESGFQPARWSAATEMTKALASVKAQFDTPDVSLNNRSIGKALLTFLNTGDLPNFIELKYACFGLAQPVGPRQWSLIDDAERFPAFLKRVDKEKANPRRFRKCFQGLMHSYFSYGIFDDPSEVAKANWKSLQRYLRGRLSVALSASNMPNWLGTLSDHENLLSPKPCERYAPAMIKGDASELAAAAERVGIASTSWVWQEAMLAHTQAVVKNSDDAEYRALMMPLIDLLAGKGDMTLSETVVAQCTALLLIRYTKCKDRTEHAQLRDLAVNHIGNPWLNRAAWDAYVNNEDARKMVDGWLKRRLITDFFALLSQDGSADQRRLNYWLEYEPVIEDMWFVLGTHARTNTSSDFKAMRKRMEGRLHYLDGIGATSENNAFIMRIGSYMVIEFGVTGNACYVFHLSDFKIDFSQRFIDINRLKGKNNVGRLIHKKADWEAEFDRWLKPRIGGDRSDKPKAGSASAARPKPVAPTPEDVHRTFEMEKLEALAMQRGLAIKDLRSKQGALWVLTHNQNPATNARLEEMGFRYKASKGWWKE